ncbi:MAG TPA: signal recognition particle protein [Candidatus Babeliales bacterium]|nr:signal recognition particle protein [Candidatus Babeliales bacterium]
MFDFLSQKFSSIFSQITGKSTLTEQNMQEALDKVKDALLAADVPQELVETFVIDIQKEAVGQKVLKSLKPGDQLIKIVHERLKAFMGSDTLQDFSFQLPATIMVMGLQGSGKTTTIAKLMHYVLNQAKKRNKKRNVLCASIDFYRPAAIDQLEILAKQVGVSFYRSSKTDPVAAALDIQQYARQQGFELLFLDTAGRLHVDQGMLGELRTVDLQLKPRYKLLVLDAMTGQESLNVAQAFEQAVGYQYAILSKMDSDTRGGAAFVFRYAQKKPILFVGIGEKIDDLEQFYPDRMAGRILGMGDVLTLIERATDRINESEQEVIQASFMKGKLNLQDFANQLDMMSKIGSLSQIAKYIPGMNSMNIPQEKLEKGEAELIKFKAIINSMTPKERIVPRLLDGSRKQRIARGAGVTLADINVLLQRFEESQQYVKLFKKFGRRGPGMF